MKQGKVKTLFLFLAVLLVTQCFLEYNCLGATKIESHYHLSKIHSVKTLPHFPEYCKSLETSDDIIRSNTVQPVFNYTSQDKFLLPWLYNGPNNQLFGLRQAVYVAVALERILVLPIFFKHFMDVDEGDTTVKVKVDAAERLNVKKLMELLPMISYPEYRKRFEPSEPDIIFLGTSLKSWATEELKQAESMLKLKILDSKVEILPHNPKKNHHISSNRQELNKIFDTESRFAFYAFPFRELDFPKSEEEEFIGTSELQQNPRITDENLRTLIEEVTQAPQYFTEIAGAFIDQILGGKPFISLHWRYDQNDFIKFMCGDGNPQRGNKTNTNLVEMCRMVIETKPESVIRGIDLLRSGIPQLEGRELDVYLAAPASTHSWLLNRLIAEPVRTKINFFTSKDLDKFLDGNGRRSGMENCTFLNNDDRSDAISMLEMEICSMSEVFIRSVYSSWSDNVMIARKFKKTRLHQKYDMTISRLMKSLNKGAKKSI